MPTLPEGTLTLLFSDIEGSTKLVTRLGPAWGDALAQQRRLLRQAWATHDGVEIGTEGDSFFVVFTSARQAAAAALEAQRALAEATWPNEESIRVRMGLHTGTPLPHDGGYVGMDVHRAARIASIAHGGQVLLSEATALLLPAGDPEVKDLGRHHLKDLPQPERIFQLIAPGLRQDFPPPRSLGSTSRLPRPTTPLVGREKELAALEALIEREGPRVITLTGPGGTGKTRLALALAERRAMSYVDGVFFVSLETVTTAETMWTSISSALELPPEGRIPPGLFDHVARTTALLVLDNLEQVADAATVVAELAAAAPSLLMVATSRHPLRVQVEQEFPVEPLAVPEEGGVVSAEDLTAFGAVELFVARARLVRPGFRVDEGNRTAVLEICRRLDGLPLALELVSARLRLLSPAALARRLGDALDIADRDPRRTQRQSTLRSAIGWSHTLLDEDDRRVFRGLGVFSGGADVDAVDAVVLSGGTGGVEVLERLESLVEASLLVAGESSDGEPRVTMLNTVRSFALDELRESGEEQQVRDRMTGFFSEQLRDLDGQGYFTDRNRWRARVEADVDNYRATLAWLLRPEPPADTRRADLARMMVCGLTLELWAMQGYLDEARDWCEQALAARADAGTLSRAAAELALAEVARSQGRLEEWGELVETARPVLLAAEPDGIFEASLVALLRHAALVASVYQALMHGRLDEARAHAEQGLTLPGLTDATLAYADLTLADVEGAAGDPAAALERQVAAVEAARRSGDELLVASAEWGRAESLLRLGRLPEAEQVLREATTLFIALRAPEALAAFAEIWVKTLVELGRWEEAAELLGAVEAMRERVGAPRDPAAQRELDAVVGPRREELGARWSHAEGLGRGTTVENVLELVAG